MVQFLLNLLLSCCPNINNNQPNKHKKIEVVNSIIIYIKY